MSTRKRRRPTPISIRGLARALSEAEDCLTKATVESPAYWTALARAAAAYVYNLHHVRPRRVSLEDRIDAAIARKRLAEHDRETR